MTPSEPQDKLLAELASGDETRAEDAARQLAELGEPVVPALEPLLRSEQEDHRWWAVRTLGQMSVPRMDWLVQALGDPSADVRAAAALALAAHPTADAVPGLILALQDDDNVLAVLAVNALAAIGKDAVPGLLDAFPSANPRGKIHIMRAIAELRDHRAIPLMMRAIEGESAMLRYWAEQGIERLGLNMVYIKPE